MSGRTERLIEKAPILPSQRARTRRYRTRQNLFAEVWRADLVSMLAALPGLRATTLLEKLQRRHSARYPERMLRSLQRRVGHWRATEELERLLIFRSFAKNIRRAYKGFRISPMGAGSAHVGTLKGVAWIYQQTVILSRACAPASPAGFLGSAI